MTISIPKGDTRVIPKKRTNRRKVYEKGYEEK